MSKESIADKVDFRASSAHAAFSQQDEASSSSKEAQRWLKNHNNDEDNNGYDDEGENGETDSVDDFEEINISRRKVVRPARPPIPDLRFEQSYRKAIAKADGVWWKIALITIKDQVIFTLLQGFLWQLALVGIRSWRLKAMSHGSSYGGKFIWHRLS